MEKAMTQGEKAALKEAKRIVRDVEAWDDLGMRHASKYSEDDYLYATDIISLLEE